MTKYYQLTHVHFQNRLWRNELETIQHEVEFFLEIVDEMPTDDSTSLNANKQSFRGQFHHFQRLTLRLMDELQTLEKEIAEGVLNDNILDNIQNLDHEYLKEEMDYLEEDYRIAKKKFKEFVVAVNEPIID
jgi:hypothetical protein